MTQDRSNAIDPRKESGDLCLNVLLVDDDEDDCLLTRDLLQDIPGQSFNLDWVSNYDDAVEALKQNRHDIYLFDYLLGAHTGLELLGVAHALECKGPVILLTGQGEREVDIEAMKAGAADYLVKGNIDASLLERSIRYALERNRYQAALREMNTTLESRVQDRTLALEKANIELRAEAEQRRRIDEALRQSEERVRMALSAARMVAWDWDLRTDSIEFSENAASVLGLGSNSALKTSELFSDHIHPDDLAAHQTILRDIIEKSGSYVSHFRFIRPANGNILWLEDRGNVILNGDQGAVRIVGVLMDITDRKRAELELASLTEESDRLRRVYETALSNTADLIYVFDLDHRFVYANAALLKMWGRTWKDAIGKNCHELGYPTWQANMHDEEIEQVIETGQTVRGEVPFTGTLGRRIYEYIFAPVVGADGNVVAVAGSTRDVTERKAMEDNLRQLAANLSEADRRKNEFLATLAHELRNPMAPIRNGLQLLRVANDSAAQEEARAMMERQLGQMVRLVDDLLDISRITRNKMDLRKARITLRAVIENAVETARPQIDTKGHTLNVELPDEPVYLDADLIRLAQVFWNLLNNSAKYTEPGGRIELVARLRRKQIVVSVRDNGIGIPEESLARLFEMFSQVDQSRGRAEGGLGIGLALVKGLTEMHGGTVSAASAGIDRGCTMTVTLPVHHVGALPESPARDPGTAASQSQRILVVDDNRDGAASLAMLLSVMGNDTRTAHDGMEAIELADAFRPDIIVLDIGLPKLSGYEVCRRIRESDWGKKIMIVAATGWGQDEDRKRSKEAGFNHHLVKPIDLDAFKKLLSVDGSL